MAYNQITTTGAIAPGPDPKGPTPKRIREIIFESLNQDGMTFEWAERASQPYSGVVDMGSGRIELYIYAWRISNGGRKNLVSEKRIQIRKGVNNVGFLRPTTDTQKTLLLGIYDSPAGIPIFAAWDATAPRNIAHTQKSCQVSIENLQAAISEGIHQCIDSQGNTIYTFMPDYLGDYIGLVKTGNTLAISATATGDLSQKVKEAVLPSKKKRTVKTLDKILQQIEKLSVTEKEAITKQRIGQGLFKDLLMGKYNCKCALCGVTTERMLVGSHIKAWKTATDAEKLDINNGLLLCAHHDALFDKHLISFEDDGTLLVSPTLTHEEKQQLNIASIPPLDVSPEMIPYLANHRRMLRV